MFLLCVLVAAVLPSVEDGGLTLTIYDNTGRQPNGNTKTSTLQSTNFTVPTSTGPFSADLEGTIRFPSAGIYAFNCSFALTSTAWVWVDGHLVCQDGRAYLPDTGM